MLQIRFLLILFCWFATSCHLSARAEREKAEDAPEPKVHGNRITMTQQPFKVSGQLVPVLFKPISDKEFSQYLDQRIDGGLAYTFGQFANMFVVSSQLKTKYMIGLVTASDSIVSSELIPAFPENYKPTVREFLDQIALETSSIWSFERTGRFIVSDKALDKPMENCVCIEFTPAKKAPIIEFDLAKSWKAVDRGSWLQCMPRDYPAGMDIYDMGSYSSDEKVAEKLLEREITKGIVLGWAKRVKADATEKDLRAGKVGDHDAVYFEAELKGKNGEVLRWREWAFMIGNRAFMVLSTMIPQQESVRLPEVQAMLKSFRLK